VDDIGNARADKDFIDLFAGGFGQVDFYDFDVLSVGISLEQCAVGNPRFHGNDAAP